MAEHGQHSHKHDHGHQHGEHHQPKTRGLHKDWRVWVAVILALAAMTAYLATMDEALPPGAPAGQRMPAADAP